MCVLLSFGDQMESNTDNVGGLDILRKALLVVGSNIINFITVTVITSFPMFCILVYFEFLLQKFLDDAMETLKPSSQYRYYYRSEMFDVAAKLKEDILYQFIHLGFLYLVPLRLLELVTAHVTVDLASKVYREYLDPTSVMSLKDMMQKPLSLARLRGTFTTCVYVTLLSSSTLLGLAWLVTMYVVILRNTMYYPTFALLCGASFVALLGLHLALSAEWNMSVVISVSEGVYGPAALALSSFFSVGSHRRGLVLMLVFFVWGMVLRLPCLYIGCYKGGGYGIVALQICFLCLGNALKWVVCLVYFQDCQNKRILENNFDRENSRL